MAIQNVRFTDNSKEVQSAFKKQIANALEAIGITAERYAKQDCPVDTGRLRNSIAHDHDQKSAVIGSNVSYAPAVELLNRPHKVGKAHFLRDAAAQHGNEYKKIVEISLKS